MAIKKFCSFYLGDRYYGIDILDVREISLLMEFNSVPHASEEVKGLVNIRGEIHVVIDLRVLFKLPSLPFSPSSRLIIFKPSVAPPFGVLVDRIGDVMEVEDSLVEERRQSRDLGDDSGDGERRSTASITGGLCKFEKELMIILDAHKLVRFRDENLS